MDDIRYHPQQFFRTQPLFASKAMLFSILHVSVLQIMNSSYQFSKGTKSNGIFPFLKVSYCALG